MSLRNQKDTLAKLMAAENLTVVHKKVPTAVFDVQNRILTCPILKEDISSELYDLFMGHEVGHALYTPLEGLHSALSENRTLKGYLNVVEDVRIERKIRDKFNGLRKSFYTAYQELMEIDFFGIQNINIQDLSLIDRINLHSKCGSRLGVKFTEEEQVFVDRSFQTETWEEVVELANEIYEFSKDNEVRTDMDDLVTPQFDFDEFDFDEDGEESGDFSSSFGDSDEESEEDGESGEESQGDDSGEESEEQNQTTESGQETSDNQNQTTESGDEEGEPAQTSQNYQGGQESSNETAREAMTEWNAHDNEDMFVSTENQLNFVSDLSDVYRENDMLRNNVVGFKDVQSMVTEWSATAGDCYNSKDSIQLAKWTAKKLVEKNKKIVNHMAKEFEMRQSAHVSLHARTAKSGRLDPNKLATYQVVDDVFQRTMMLPKGKNHGINLMLDWSGSIARQVPDLMEQALILAMFCEKVQIPYRVYLFTSQYKTDNWVGGREGTLVEILSNEMRPKEYKYGLEVVSLLWNAHFVREKSWGRERSQFDSWFDGCGVKYISVDTPRELDLGGTPLDDCLFTMRTALKDFNDKYKVEKSVLTILTDGYSHDAPLLEMSQEERNEFYISPHGTKMTRTIIDPFTRKAYNIPVVRYGVDRFSVTQALIDWVATECNATVTGFFVMTKKHDFVELKRAIYGADFTQLGDDRIRKEWADLRKNGIVLSGVKGYNKLILAFNTTADGDDGLDDSLVGEKKGKLLSAFRKNQKGKMTSRFIANEFMKEVA